MKRKFGFRPISGIALGALLGLSPAPSRALTVVHTNDIMGELEPCGCRTNPLGGMAREFNLLKQSHDQEMILLDGGDLLFSTDEIPEALKKQSKLQAKYLIKALNLVHQDAVVPGEKDFALGVSAFEKLAKGAHFKFIAANLKFRSGKKFVDSHVLLRRKDANGKTITIAVVGLVGEGLSWPKELKASSAIAAAKAEMQALRGKADYFIALTHQGLENDGTLAKAVPGFQLIIGAHTQSFLQVPAAIGHDAKLNKKVPDTFLLQSSFRNQYVGLMPLGPSAKAEDYKLIGLDAGYDSPAQTPSAMDDLVKQFKTAIAELNAHEEAEMTSISSNHAGAVKFQTFPRCSECHLKQFDFWRKTPHAQALATLVKAGQAQNKECLSCHTVGLGDPQGFEFVTRLAETRQAEEVRPMPLDDLHKYLESMTSAGSLDSMVRLTPNGPSMPLKQSLNSLTHAYSPVQCENCHQPGREHPFFSGYSKQVDTSATCLKCHTPERAPEWYKDKQPDWKTIEAKRAKVTCPAGELPPAE